MNNTHKGIIRQIVVSKWAHRNARNPQIRRDGSVVVTVDGLQGKSTIFAGWAEDLEKEIPDVVAAALHKAAPRLVV